MFGIPFPDKTQSLKGVLSNYRPRAPGGEGAAFEAFLIVLYFVYF